MSRGRIAGELSRQEASEERILNLAVGGEPEPVNANEPKAAPGGQRV
jgi:hypothetical protein